MQKRKFDIITDTGCDMLKEYFEEHEIIAVRLGYMLGNVSYEGEDGATMSEKEFYARLREGAMPTTYQITSETAKTYIEDSLQKGNDVLIISFSSGLSGTAGSFQVAARELALRYPDRKICVVDSLCASMGQGLLLDYVVKKADEGASVEQTAQYAEALKLHICHQFTVDNLFHLKRGGRVSSATAIVGTILKIKPVMHVNNDGKLVPVAKAMGRKKALHMLVDNMMATQDIGENDPIFISHGDCEEDVEYVRGLIMERFPLAKLFVNYIGPVIGTHSGCGTLAIFHKGTHR